jgi:DNA-binding CsgD family transcriptional regulator
MWRENADRMIGLPAGQALAGDPEWLSDTIGTIYDCVLDPQRWHSTIEAIGRQFSFASSALGIVSVESDAQDLKVHIGGGDEWLAFCDSHAKDTVALWGGAARIGAYPLDEPILASKVAPAAEWKNNRYRREILEPRGMIDAAIVTFVRQPRLTAYLGLNRHRSAGKVRTAELNGLRLLAPHMRRAITISNLLDLKAMEARTFRSVLDSTSCAMVLVDAALRIVHANRAADDMLLADDPVQSFQGRLKLRGESAQSALKAAVRLAAENETHLGQRGIGVPARGEDDEPALLHILPLKRGEIRLGLEQRAVAAIFVVTGSRAADAPVDAIATLYDLTPAESQVFASLSQGKSLEKTAMTQGIAKSTARTHLLRVFAKTGCQRQAELVTLGASFSLKL